MVRTDNPPDGKLGRMTKVFPYPANRQGRRVHRNIGSRIANDRTAGYEGQQTALPPRTAWGLPRPSRIARPRPRVKLSPGSEGIAMCLQLFVRHAADVVIVDLTGIATMGPANDFMDSQLRQLIDDGTNKILVNLTDVTQMDSSGIGTIVRAFISLQHRGASLKLLRPRGNVRLVLETVHLLDVIPSMEDETQGIASFG